MKQFARLLHLPVSLRRMGRMRRILSVLARHGFADVARRSGIHSVWRGAITVATLGRARGRRGLTTGERLRAVFEELGATFIKFGQMLANRRDLLPESVTSQLAHLQDDVPPFAFEEVEPDLEKCWGRSVSEVFEELNRVPIAAASIGQVHRGVLKDGRVVAVKVRRPGIRGNVRKDLDVLVALARYLGEAVPEWSHLQLPGMVEEFSRTMMLEMDFRNEVRNLQRFGLNFKHEAALRVPQAIEEYCCEDAIVMDFVDGVKIGPDTPWDTLAITPQEVAEIGVRVMLKSIFEDRFFHADPHPGNFLVEPGGKVALLDFGMMGHIEEPRMAEMLSFMVALVSNDAQMLVETVLEAGLANEDVDRRALQRDAEMMMSIYKTASLRELNMEELIRQATDVVFRHRIRLPSDLVMVARALSTMEGIAQQIYPQFVPLEAMQPYLLSLFLRKGIDPTPYAEIVTERLFDWADLLAELPRDLTQVMRRLKKGEIKVHLDDPALEQREDAATRRTNRMVGAVVGLGGSGLSLWCLESCTSVPSWFSGTCLVASGLMTLWVVWGIVRSGGM